MVDKGDIYMITNILENKRYIGQAKCYLTSGRKNGANIRWKHHINRALRNDKGCPYLYNAILKYGIENFTMEILIKCDLSKLDYYEKYFIEIYNTKYPNGYNIESGGNKNKNLHENTRLKISESTKNRYISDDNKEKLKNLNIDKLPYGIQFTSTKSQNIEGFIVNIKGFPKKFFTSKQRKLIDKYNLSIEYYNLCKNNDLEGINIFSKKIDIESRKLISNSTRKLNEKVINVLKELNIDNIPEYIRYDKRGNQFYVKLPNIKSSKYFKKDNLIDSLKSAIEYKLQFVETGIGMIGTAS